MRVTDEMVEAAKAEYLKADGAWCHGDAESPGESRHSYAIRRALTAALSHASGQEAEYPECTGDPKDCPENEGHGCCKTAPTNPAEIGRKSVGGEAVADDGSWVVERNAANCPTCGASCVAEVRAWYDQHLGSQRRTNYLTHAQPPASAEVVPPHDAEEYQNIAFTSDERIAAIRRQAEATGWNKCRAWVIAAMAASSGRKGGDHG